MELPNRGYSASPTPAARHDFPRRRFPRTVFTSTITDTKPVAAAMQIAFGRGAPETSTTLSIYNHSWPTTDVIKLLAALLSVPADREAWIYCDSSWAVNSVSTFSPTTGRYTWSTPAENYTPSTASMVGKFEIRDLVEEIRRTVARRLERGYRTWLRLEEGAVSNQSKSETAGNNNSQSGSWI